jgi:hypothetical protein
MIELEPLKALTRDLKTASKTLGNSEARFLVDSYYALQEFRISSANQVRQLATKEDGTEPEPHQTLAFFNEQFGILEEQIKKALDAYSNAHVAGVWARSNLGIGPVIAAGLLAYIDIDKTPSVSSLWSFAGLNPTQKWEKGEKRPWNAGLRVLQWKIGESFVKVSGNENAFYGRLYAEKKISEVAKNENKAFADQAARVLSEKKIGKTTDAYKAYSQGLLPPAHVHARAKRYAVKLFLSHYWQVAYEAKHGSRAPRAYAFAHLEHVHEIPPPNWTRPAEA